MRILVTGAAGFIGSAVARLIDRQGSHSVVAVDKLTYAADPQYRDALTDPDRHVLERVDICDHAALAAVFDRHQPDAVMHLAAESHVDRSIDGPGAFVNTNVTGTFTLLDVARRYWEGLPSDRRDGFRFHHISTDEVFGSLGPTGRFTETTAYDPRSPYSASKAASDHFVKAWHHTYGLPIVLTNCSNNYGPYQFPEKLIPLMILNALERKPLPVYGDGGNIRDWLHVEDHAQGLLQVLRTGRIGETYAIGGDAERTNLQVVRTICALVDELAPDGQGPRDDLITFVADRPGHDRRYAIDSAKIRRELGWRPRHSFDSGLRASVAWYLANRPWWERIRAGRYDGQRLGLTPPLRRAS